MKKFILPLIAALSVTSCATYQSGPTQKISVTSAPSGADCRYNNKASSGSFKTPTTIVVERSKSNLEIQCSLQGFGQGDTTLQPGANWWTAANIANLGVGYFVDLNNGSLWKYPEVINIPLQAQGGAYGANYMMNNSMNAVVPTVTMPHMQQMDMRATQPQSQQSAMAEAMRDMEMMSAEDAPAYTPPNFDQPMQQQYGMPQYGMPQQYSTPQQQQYIPAPQQMTPQQQQQYQQWLMQQRMQMQQQQGGGASGYGIPGAAPNWQQQMPGQLP